MRLDLLACGAAIVPLALAGCIEGDAGRVQEVILHVGWDATRTAQYVLPAHVEVDRGDRVRFIVTNDDDPQRDYSPNKPGNDNYHELVLAGYDGDGDGILDEIRHDVPAGMKVSTTFKGRDYFVASTPGSFRLVCGMMTSPTHDALGMNATFVVK